jgi:hypothetical protein
MEDLRYEQETVIESDDATIRFNQAESIAYVWSASPIFQRKMKKLGVEPTKTAPRERGWLSAWYEIPKIWVRIAKVKKRQFTEEQRQTMADRARRAFSKKTPADRSEPLDNLSEKMSEKGDS